MRGIASGLVLLALPLAAQAEIFKCIDETEHVTYQDKPCPVGSVREQMGRSAVSGMDSAAIQTAARANMLRDMERQSEELQAQLEQLSQASRTPSTSSSYQERLEARNEAVRARARGIVPTGSDVRDAERMLGRPDSRRVFSSSGQNCERLIWRDRDDYMTGHATACNGKIVHFSNRDN